MYLRVVLTLNLLVAAAIAARVWRPDQAAPGPGPGTGPGAYPVWPRDRPGLDPVLEKRLARVDVRSDRIEDALVQFRRQAGVNVLWSEAELRTVTFDPIRVELQDVTVGAALRRVLASGVVPPPFAVRDGIVVVGADPEVLHLYNVRDLARPDGPWASRGVRLGGGDSRRPLVELTGDRLDGLAWAIMNGVRPGAWEPRPGAAGRLTEWDGIFMIRQSPEVHREIAAFLDAISTGPEPPLAGR